MHNPWIRRARQLVYQNPWIAVYHDDVRRPDGKPGMYGVVHYKHRAVGVVAVDAHDQLLLVGQYRYTLDHYSWEIPEGGATADEELLEAAQRELREETGVTARSWKMIVRSHLSNSVSDEDAYIFLAENLTTGVAAPEPTEQLQVRWMPVEEALRMMLAGEITDSMSVLGLQRLALMRAGK
jgi:8-oxo-dGTP pyrophosphatase MutT (NUDIX family)